MIMPLEMITIILFSLIKGILSQNTQEKSLGDSNHEQQCDYKLAGVLQAEIAQLRELISRKTEFVSFTANPSVPDLRVLDGERIIFDATLNNIGQAYTPSNGSFVCPRHGIYLFNLNLWVKEGTTASVVLYKENQVVMRATAWAQEIFRAHSGNTITVECLAGETLWFKAAQNGYIHTGYSNDDNRPEYTERRQSSWTGLAIRYLD